MHDIMVINNGSSTTDSRSLQMDHLDCLKPPTSTATFIRGESGKGLENPTLLSIIGKGESMGRATVLLKVHALLSTCPGLGFWTE